MTTVLSRKLFASLHRYWQFLVWVSKTKKEGGSSRTSFIITVIGTFFLVTENYADLLRYSTDYLLFFGLYPLSLYVVFEVHRDYFLRNMR